MSVGRVLDAGRVDEVHRQNPENDSCHREDKQDELIRGRVSREVADGKDALVHVRPPEAEQLTSRMPVIKALAPYQTA